MSAVRKPQRTVRMTLGQAVRCAAMDAEAGRPQAAMIVWVDEHGRMHKRVLPGSQVLEDGLFQALDRLPPGSTPTAGVRQS